MALTLSRMLAGPIVAGLIFWAATETYVDPSKATLIFIAAATIFALAALTDWFDGVLARRNDAVTPLGAALDHCADKVLVGCALIALCFQALPLNLVIATVILLARELAVAGLREGLSNSGRPLPVGAIGKWKAAAAMIGTTALILEQAAVLGRWMELPYLTAAWTARGGLWLAVALALVSAYEYVAAALDPAPAPSGAPSVQAPNPDV